jgi:tetratricopeptide (TPR) repeat protein
MSTSVQKRMALEYYKAGCALFRQARYAEALLELNKAENLFRELDARGHPFSNPISNGVSGLANCLAVTGLCHQKLRNYPSAVTAYETSLINSKFEKKKPFRKLWKQVSNDMIFCYGKICEKIPAVQRRELASSEPLIDISFRFPYSLPPDAIPLARLYELSPGQYPDYAHFYETARKKDAAMRRRSKWSDDAPMKKLSIYVWAILFMIWTVYLVIAVEALFRVR